MEDTYIPNMNVEELKLVMQISKAGDREQIFDQLYKHIVNGGVNSAQLETLFQQFDVILFQFYDSKSKYIVKNFIDKLGNLDNEEINDCLFNLLRCCAKKFSKLHSSVSVAKTCLSPLLWSVILLNHLKKKDKLEQNKLNDIINIQAQLLDSVLEPGCSRLNKKAYKSLMSCWTLLSAEEMSTACHSLDESMSSILYGSYFIKFLTDENIVTNSVKNHLLTLFIQLILKTKKPPPPYVVSESKYLTSILSSHDFEVLYGHIQKAVLRSPEIILETVSNIFTQSSIDLSLFGSTFGESFGGLFRSKDDEFLKHAVDVWKCFALSCKDVECIMKLSNELMALFNSTKAELSSPPQRISILQALGCLACAPCSTPNQKFQDEFIGKLMKIFSSEVNETILVSAIDVLIKWAPLLEAGRSTQLCNWFMKCLKLKTSTHLVIVKYLICINKCFCAEYLEEAENIGVMLLEHLSKCVSGTGQAPKMCEAFLTCTILLRLNETNQTSHDFSALWSFVKSCSKSFCLAKNLPPVTDEMFYETCLLSKKLILNYNSEIRDNLGVWFEYLFHGMTLSPRSEHLKVQIIFHEVVRRFGPVQAASIILDNFEDNFSSFMLTKEHWDKNACLEYQSATLIQFLIEVARSLALMPEEQKSVFAKRLFLICCYPFIYSSNKDVWSNVLNEIKFPTTSDWASSFLEEIFESEDPKYIQKNMNSVMALSEMYPYEIVDSVVKFSLKRLNNGALLAIDSEDYKIYHTPEGELYDKSVLPNVSFDESLITKNLKRENKAYSYKEQLEEIELRKEIAAKKKNEKKELTPKQKEIVEAQLKKEKAIRERCAYLDKLFCMGAAYLKAVVNSQPKLIGVYIKTLMDSILSLLRSPLCAPDCCEIILKLSQCVFKNKDAIFGKSLAHTILRTQNPSCNLEANWNEEPLQNACARLIASAHDNCLVSEDSFDAEPNVFSANEFSYLFILCKVILRGDIDLPDAVLIQCLQLITHHCDEKFLTPASKFTLEDAADYPNHPRLLPLLDMINVLLLVIARKGGKIKILASELLPTITSICKSCPGVSVFGEEEIRAFLKGLQNASPDVRLASLKGIQNLSSEFSNWKDTKLYSDITKRIHIAGFDPEKEICFLSYKVWDEASLTLESVTIDDVLIDIIHMEEDIRRSSACASANYIKHMKVDRLAIFNQLIATYESKLEPCPAVYDDLGRELAPSIDYWESRMGVACALAEISPFWDQTIAVSLMTFYVKKGLVDRHVCVRDEMLNAAKILIPGHTECRNDFLSILNESLENIPNTSIGDFVKESIIVLMGHLARYNELEDTVLLDIVHKLIATLKTPSQQVQEAIAQCLENLSLRLDVKVAKEILTSLVNSLLTAESYGARRGAACGVAGIARGNGIVILKQSNLVKTLLDAVQNKQNAHHREGALLAFQMLCNLFGKLFEPYVVYILPHLLYCFGDSNQFVREAANDTAKAVMSNLSYHGVKLVLPTLLSSFNEGSWRTKIGSVELLGAMAYCAPKQLSSCLPSVVPKVMEVLGDSHLKVQKAGARALKLIGSVIRNPEIQEIVPVLLEALDNPAMKTSPCLQSLIDTEFVHFIDAASLALIMPVVERAFQDRSTETRKMAAQIIGNMYSLTDEKDLKPYLHNIIPGLKASLIDPVPEVRAVSARALGSMVKGVGETCFNDLLPWLMETLTANNSSVDRSGAAQGLSEVVGALGEDKLHTIMPNIISTAERNDINPYVKDGCIMMFIYMPVVFRSEFTFYIGRIINPILNGLADENEFVRDTALKAGQRLVNMYAESAITLLLPELEKGLFDSNWRIRYSSVQLLGDLLFKISGVSGKMTTETASEDDNFGTMQIHKAIIKKLGMERRDRVFAGLYIARADVSVLVSQSALHVWKLVITNTPKTLREILPTLFTLLLKCLSSTSYDKRQIAAKTLGDLVKKLGERVLPEMIPILEKGLECEQSDQRQGVCIGLSEIMGATSREMILTFVGRLVPTVSKALCDPLPEVRKAAAKTFESLHQTVGLRAIDDIIPSVLNKLNDSSVADYALDGLKQIVVYKNKVVFSYMVPHLVNPINVKALSELCIVAGDALSKPLPKILPPLLTAMCNVYGAPDQDEVFEQSRKVILAVNDELGLRVVVDELLDGLGSNNNAMKIASATLLSTFCSQSKLSYQEYIPQLYRALLYGLIQTDEPLLIQLCECLQAVTNGLKTHDYIAYTKDLCQALNHVTSDFKGDKLPGFAFPKGVSSIIPIFRESILNGDAERKEIAAKGLFLVVSLASPEALKPTIVNITGPLIRILGDRFEPSIKVVFLDTITIMLVNISQYLRPFLPQLQATFMKALINNSYQVRIKAGDALKQLTILNKKPAVMYKELIQVAVKGTSIEIRETGYVALHKVLEEIGDLLTEPHKKEILDSVLELISSPHLRLRTSSADCFAALARYLSDSEFQDILNSHIIVKNKADMNTNHGRIFFLGSCLRDMPEKLLNTQFQEACFEIITSNIGCEEALIAKSAVRCCGYTIKYFIVNEMELPSNLLIPLAKNMNHKSTDVIQAVCFVAQMLAKSITKLLPREIIRALVPMLMNGTKEKKTVVKSSSEAALISILKLRDEENCCDVVLSMLNVGARESLNDVINKVLKKLATLPEEKEDLLIFYPLPSGD